MFQLLLDDIKDRLKGNTAKANARLGLVNAPQGRGKLIWLLAGASRDSVVMGAALLAAIREKRKDVRLVLTYQVEYPDVLVQHFNGLSKIGFGYGVGNSQFAARQMIKRLSPLAVILVGEQPHKALLKVLLAHDDIHKVAFQFTPDAADKSIVFEACYPNVLDTGSVPKSLASHVSPPFSVLTRLVQSQIDKQLGAMLCGDVFQSLFHVHNLLVGDVDQTLRDWQNSVLSESCLIAFSFEQLDRVNMHVLVNAVEKAGYSPLLLSQWKQQPLLKKQIVIADEAKWYAALCAASVATHLIRYSQENYWQAMSSGAVISMSKQPDTMALNKSDMPTQISTVNAMFRYWLDVRNDPLQQRSISDGIRKMFWRERRRAQAQVDELLQRVYDW